MLLTITRPGQQAIYRLRPTEGEDSYGDPVKTWEPPARFRLRGAELQRVAVGTAESETERPSGDTLRNVRRLFVPSAASLTAEDRIEADGEVWRIDGKPEVRRGLAMSVYTSAYVRRVEGLHG